MRSGIAFFTIGAVVVLSGCGSAAERASTPEQKSADQTSTAAGSIAGGPSAARDGLNQIAGQTITDVPSGLRPDAPTEIRPVTNTDNGEIDRIAAMSVADVEEFWSGAYGPPLSGTFVPVADLFSWDSADPSPEGKFCSRPTAAFPNASFCGGERQNCTPSGSCSNAYNTIGWDRAEMIPQLQRAFGDNGVGLVLAHEYGHAIQRVSSDLNPRRSIVAEQQADCFAGVYARWVTDGKSPRFTLNTGEGLNKLLTELLGIRDAVESEEDRRASMGMGEHGSAFERISAFEMGFNDSTPACAGINEGEIAQRRGNLPVALQSGESGENPVTEESVRVLGEALNTVFAPSDPPAISFDQYSCSDARASGPTSYCPSTNTVYADISGLADQAISISGDQGERVRTLPQFGDYTSYSAVVSRYALAIQQERGLELDSATAGLRTACLTGVATAAMSDGVPVSGDQTIRLTAGDLDEAVAGLLADGLMAADVNGDYTPNGFARVAAFRTGVLGDQDTCFKTYA